MLLLDASKDLNLIQNLFFELIYKFDSADIFHLIVVCEVPYDKGYRLIAFKLYSDQQCYCTGNMHSSNLSV